MHISAQQALVIFNKLIVNSIEDSSGIFVGANQAIGWSSSSKTNQGFGNLSNASVSHSINAVFDPDLIDAPIRESRFIQIVEPAGAQNSAISFHTINANAINSGSSVDIGDNRQPGWRTSRKNNYGNGKAYGINQYTRLANFIMDSDHNDMPVQVNGIVTEGKLPSE